MVSVLCCRDAPSVCDMTHVSSSPCTARLVVALPRLWMWVTTPRLLSTQPHSGRGNSCVTSGTTVLGDPWQLAHLECTQPCSLAVPSMPPGLTPRRLSLLACFHVQVWKRARPEFIQVQWPMRYWALRQCRGLDNAHVLRPMRSRLHLPCWIDQAHCCAMPRCGGLVAVWSSRGGRFIILVVSVFFCRGSCFVVQAGRTVMASRAVASVRYDAGVVSQRHVLTHLLCRTAVRPQAGYYCPPASSSPRARQCGGIGFYCPAGSSAPLQVAAGHYTLPSIGASTTRTAQALCPVGFFCVGDGQVRMCPAGTYGVGEGAQSSACSGLCLPGRYGSGSSSHAECDGPCAAGYYCEAGSVSPTSTPCPGGRSVCAGCGLRLCAGPVCHHAHGLCVPKCEQVRHWRRHQPVVYRTV